MEKCPSGASAAERAVCFREGWGMATAHKLLMPVTKRSPSLVTGLLSASLSSICAPPLRSRMTLRALFTTFAYERVSPCAGPGILRGLEPLFADGKEAGTRPDSVNISPVHAKMWYLDLRR